MKAHKYWSLGALACMAGCFYTGCKKLMQAHKYFACGSLVCMGMAIYSGHNIHEYSFMSNLLLFFCSFLSRCLKSFHAQADLLVFSVEVNNLSFDFLSD